MKLTPFILLVIAIITAGAFIGCAPPSTLDTGLVMTPEQRAAYEDSLRAEREKELKIIRSFAYSHYNNKNWTDAAKYYAELLEKDTDHKYPDYGKWAHCCIQMNVPADSVKMVYTKGIDAYPEDAYLHASLGHILRTQGLLEEAAIQYEAAVRSNSEELDYQKTLAELYVRIDRPLEAIELYRGVLDKEPDNKNIAEVLQRLVQDHLSPEEYIKSLEEAIAQFPDDLDKKYDLAKAYSSMSRNDEALAQLERVIAVEPNNVRALEAMGDVQQNLRKYNAAVNSYLKILEIEANPDIMVEVSNVYRELGSYTRARTYARKALAVNPKMGAAYISQAEIYRAAVDNKTKGKPLGYKDKLVFVVAYGLYLDALNTGDYSVMDKARNNKNYLKESKLIPVYSDWFMHQNVKDPTASGGYDWINMSWPEVRYIEKYLNDISKK